MLNDLCHTPLDDGNENFEPSSVQLTSMGSGNEARNVVAAHAEALLNVRFNDLWTFDSLERHITSKTYGYDTFFHRFGPPFIGASHEFVETLKKSILQTIGKMPQSGTRGGNSDALFLRKISANVVEIGSPIIGAHIVDEYIDLRNLEVLRQIYRKIISDLAFSCSN
jgi:succinyl-diaminopimelate desuccinylase